MGLFDSVKGALGMGAKQKVDPKSNPYKENILITIPVTIYGEEVPVVIREIRNKKAEVKGGQATVQVHTEKVPITISDPNGETFSIGINIGLHIAVMDDFKAELARLKDEGKVSPAAMLSYNPDTKTAILYRRSGTKVNGNLQRWKDICKGNLQPLMDDFVALLPWVMNIYGEELPPQE